MTYNALAFIVLSALLLLLALVVGSLPRFPFDRRVFVAAVALRIVGSFLRYEVLFRVYRGVGDATSYFAAGRLFAARLWSGDLAVLDPTLAVAGAGPQWGTKIMEYLSGLVVTVIGPSMRAEFLVFSMLSMAGFFLIALAFRRYSPSHHANVFALVLWTWPSLWFWPSSIGKEAVITFGIGLTFFGFAGSRHKSHWILLLAGILACFIIRPHVAALVAICVAAAYWLNTWQKATFRRVVEMALMVPLAWFVLVAMSQQFGFQIDLEGVGEFMERRGSFTLRGGSNLGVLPSGPAALPMSLVNVWMRPFPWEAHNATSLLSALEIILLWTLVWLRRRPLGLALRHWYRHRLLALAVPFLVGYTLMIGLTFGNLGIIARQRTPLFFAVLLILYAIPERRRPAPRGTRGTAARGPGPGGRTVADGPSPTVPSPGSSMARCAISDFSPPPTPAGPRPGA